LNANDAVFVTQRTTTVDDEVIYYGRRRLRRRRFFFVFFFFARRESKEGKEIRIFLSLCYPSSFSLLSFSVAKSNFIIASFASLKNSDLFFLSLSLCCYYSLFAKQKTKTTNNINSYLWASGL
jgi:hypothetical protein